jgi:hypothetical protein
LSVHQHVAKGKRLRHAHQRIVNRRVAVGMVLAEDVADDARALLRRTVEVQAHFAHRIQNAAVHGL